jgi:hypothetical protein
MNQSAPTPPKRFRLKVTSVPPYLAIRSDTFGSHEWRVSGGGPMIGTAQLADQPESAGQKNKQVSVWLEPEFTGKVTDEIQTDEGRVNGNKEHEAEPGDIQPGFASPSLSRYFGVCTTERDYLVVVPDLIQRQMTHGHSEYINIADCVQVAEGDEERLGELALLITPGLSGPVRVEVNANVPRGKVRLFYSTRVLWGLERDMQLDLAEEWGAEGENGPGYSRGRKGGGGKSIWLQPLKGRLSRPVPAGAWAQVRRFGRRILEACIGAPTVPLRATEALVGDEARAVARVDSSVLDFLGVQAGDRVIVSWGPREAFARVLVQADGQRKQMLKQFRGPAGPRENATAATKGPTESPDPAETDEPPREAETASAEAGRAHLVKPAAEARTFPPWHLQVWLSPEIRRELGIPADTIVTVRRSVARFAAKNLIALEIPVAGLIIAAVAIPQVQRWWWIIPVVLFTVLVLAFAPLRLPANTVGTKRQRE